MRYLQNLSFDKSMETIFKLLVSVYLFIYSHFKMSHRSVVWSSWNKCTIKKMGKYESGEEKGTFSV